MPFQIARAFYKVLIIPYAQYMKEHGVKAVIDLKKEGFPVLFIDALPVGIVDGDKRLLAEICEAVIRKVRMIDLCYFRLKSPS